VSNMQKQISELSQRISNQQPVTPQIFAFSSQPAAAASYSPGPPPPNHYATTPTAMPQFYQQPRQGFGQFPQVAMPRGFVPLTPEQCPDIEPQLHQPGFRPRICTWCGLRSHMVNVCKNRMAGQPQGYAWAKKSGLMNGTWREDPMNPYSYNPRSPPFAPQGGYYGLNQQSAAAPTFGQQNQYVPMQVQQQRPMRTQQQQQQYQPQQQQQQQRSDQQQQQEYKDSRQANNSRVSNGTSAQRRADPKDTTSIRSEYSR
jgi:hypothetical protein